MGWLKEIWKREQHTMILRGGLFSHANVNAVKIYWSWGGWIWRPFLIFFFLLISDHDTHSHGTLLLDMYLCQSISPPYIILNQSRLSLNYDFTLPHVLASRWESDSLDGSGNGAKQLRTYLNGSFCPVWVFTRLQVNLIVRALKTWLLTVWVCASSSFFMFSHKKISCWVVYASIHFFPYQMALNNLGMLLEETGQLEEARKM